MLARRRKQGLPTYVVDGGGRRGRSLEERAQVVPARGEGEVARRGEELAARGGVGAVPQQRRRRAAVAALHRPVQRRHAQHVPRVHLSARTHHCSLLNTDASFAPN